MEILNLYVLTGRAAAGSRRGHGNGVNSFLRIRTTHIISIQYILEMATYLSARNSNFNCRDCACIDVYATFPDLIRMLWVAD